jgi:hypothetical protein
MAHTRLVTRKVKRTHTHACTRPRAWAPTRTYARTHARTNRQIRNTAFPHQKGNAPQMQINLMTRARCEPFRTPPPPVLSCRMWLVAYEERTDRHGVRNEAWQT